jgi:hypothetical protein
VSGGPPTFQVKHAWPSIALTTALASWMLAMSLLPNDLMGTGDGKDRGGRRPSLTYLSAGSQLESLTFALDKLGF